MIKLPFLLHRNHYHLNAKSSPTYFNLSRYLSQQNWHETRFHCRADFSENNFGFDIDTTANLELKNRLADLTNGLAPTIAPITFCLNDDNWASVLNQIANRYYPPLVDEIPYLAWILKPAHLNNGRHIHVFQKLSQLKFHFQSANRLGGEQVLQHYLPFPHLLQGHKYSIRMFVVLTNYAGVFLYPKGYFNVAQKPYEYANFSDLRSHLTNEHLNENETNVIQIPTTQFDFFASLYAQIKSQLTTLMATLQQAHKSAFTCHKDRKLAIFGFDFIVDRDMHVWLLEANHGPCFPIEDSHVLQQHLYQDFWRGVIAEFVLPIARKEKAHEIQYQIFESILKTNSY
ncbi:MAG: tubulin-tyrosine ligase [Gammaproteobacteria bacterium]|nr:tubulin-tyrosine ligase [Gammaproteobacteria bacterium]